MNAKTILFLIPFVFLFAPSAFASYAQVNTYAAYGSLFEEWGADSTFSPLTAAQADVFAGFGLDDYALSESRAYLDGRVRCFADGRSASGSPLYASSTAFSSADWLIESAVLPVGTPVKVRLEAVLEGLFYSENSHAVSSARAWIKIGGVEVYIGSASFAKPILTRDDNDFWTYSLSPLGSNLYDLYSPALLEFTAAVGQTINLSLFLQTEVNWTGTLAGVAWTEISGYYNYQNAITLNPVTGKFIDADLILIPEPASILLLSAGGLLLRKQRYTLQGSQFPRTNGKFQSGWVYKPHIA